jgi:hypothetical protein
MSFRKWKPLIDHHRSGAFAFLTKGHMQGFAFDLDLTSDEWGALHNRQAPIHRWLKAGGMTIGSTLIVVDHNPNFLTKPFGGFDTSSTYTLHFHGEDDAVAFVTAWLN